MNAIVLVVDGLQPAFLGCYGNAWVGTPEVDRLAGMSFVFDQFYVDSPHLAGLCRSYWEGLHAWRQGHQPATTTTLAERLRSAGVACTLLSDDVDLTQSVLAGEFDEVLHVDSPDPTELSSEIEATAFARLLAAAADWIAGAESPFLLWIHARGLRGPWDAPFRLRAQYRDDEDEEETPPPDSLDFPARRLSDEFDPDELLGIRRAYAGQVAAIDTCVGALVAALDESSHTHNTLFTMLSARGFPLGEHGRLGFVDHSLDEELVHGAWLMRMPCGAGAAARSQALVQPADLCATLEEYFQLTMPSRLAWNGSVLPIVRDEASELRDRALLRNQDGDSGIRTPAWYLKSLALQSDRDAAADDASRRADAQRSLFRKPDDRFEVNEVADRCPAVVSGLSAALAECTAAAAGPADLPWKPLEDLLTQGID